MTSVDLQGVDALLTQARAGVRRLDPHETRAAAAAGALLIDTRTDVQRAQQGSLPGAIVIDRTVMEWRLDPRSPNRIPEATDADRVIVVVCRQGYSSSLAAASLRACGLPNATDLAGGFEAWVAAGLPTTTDPEDVRY
ncbi:rhodanese-like domain-containing protein [Actinoplanes sp. Pm04-4]|uniref:Rhodanese-like domain-containing protein n=1 Tax=Paractinoplanes pyxinae TaxID=2997416 RepID=A0ABT4AXF4_9ACTN|nr:rhodanese-like domain-containing protein [Actinoplanes pyxinae]MCY1138924.1 rhodanese-like domain-containing protein [Actinoplanes pyxinae]